VLPQPVGDQHRIEIGRFPPRRLVATPVKGAMVGAAERHRELIADPAPQGSRLHESEVMGIARSPPAQQARLRRHELQMGAIAIAARLAQREGTLVDMPGNGVVHRRQLGLRRSGRLERCDRDLFTRSRLAPASVRREGRFLGSAEFYTGPQGGHQLGTTRRLRGFRVTVGDIWRRGQGDLPILPKLGHSGREGRLHDGGVDISQGVLGPKCTLCPGSGLVRRGEAIEFTKEPVAQHG
jgi:hypothetical protein